mgnify:CR=1 FL=1
MVTLPSRPRDDPWNLRTPPGTSEYTMLMAEKDGKKILVCIVGSTILRYDVRCISDLHAMLKRAEDWVALGGADEKMPTKAGSVETWGRSEANPVVKKALPRAPCSSLFHCSRKAGGWLGRVTTGRCRN